MSQSALDTEILSVLKYENKGWDIALFIDTIKASTCLCASCGSICHDAVELDCDHHDDDEIHTYCKQCLLNEIAENDNQCPLNNHINPVFVRNRSIRRQVSKSMVRCPFSVDFKKNKDVMSDDNDDIDEESTMDAMEHNDDEKEGFGVSSPFQSGCDWKGTLNDLICDHIKQCITKYDPLFALKLKNKALEKQVVSLKNELKSEKSNNDELKQRILSLENEVKQKDMVIHGKNLEIKRLMNSAKSSPSGSNKKLNCNSHNYAFSKYQAEPQSNSMQSNHAVHGGIRASHATRQRPRGGGRDGGPAYASWDCVARSVPKGVFDSSGGCGSHRGGYQRYNNLSNLQTSDRYQGYIRKLSENRAKAGLSQIDIDQHRAEQETFSDEDDW